MGKVEVIIALDAQNLADLINEKGDIEIISIMMIGVRPTAFVRSKMIDKTAKKTIKGTK